MPKIKGLEYSFVSNPLIVSNDINLQVLQRVLNHLDADVLRV